MRFGLGTAKKLHSNSFFHTLVRIKQFVGRIWVVLCDTGIAQKQCQAYCRVAMETNLPALLGFQYFEVCLGIEFRVQMNDDVILNVEKKPVASEAAKLRLRQLTRPKKQLHFLQKCLPSLTHSFHLQL